MTKFKRVLITGMGAVSALGFGVGPLWDAVRNGESGVRGIEMSNTANQLIHKAAHFPSFDPAAFLAPGSIKYTDRFAQMALIAAQEMLRDAGWPTGEPLGNGTAVLIGTGLGGALTTDREYHKFYGTHERTDPLAVPKVMCNAAASHVSMAHGAKGPSFAVSSACSSASQAIGLGLMLLRMGAAERALVGGSECLLAPGAFRAWEALRVMTPTLCRPFSKGRDGMVLGEGAALLMLETETAAAARGARPLAELAGFGTTSDAGDIVRPDAESAARAMQMALDDAGITATAIGYVNAHGTGTVLNDRSETQALKSVFGAHLDGLAVSSTKPVHGHALGAAGAIELAVTVCALREGIAPPTINWTGADADCLPDPVANVAQPRPIAAAMSNSFAFGGINTSLILRKVA